MVKIDYEKAYLEYEKVEKFLQEKDLKYDLSGSMRRKKAKVGDIDIVVCGKKEEIINTMSEFAELEKIDEEGNFISKTGIKVQIISVPESEYKYTLWSSTGSKTHVKKIMEKYKERKKNIKRDFEEEYELYNDISMAYVVPEERE